MGESLRPVLASAGVQLYAAYPGGIDADMLAHDPGPKTSPFTVAENILTGAADRQEHIFPDPESQAYARAARR